MASKDEIEAFFDALVVVLEQPEKEFHEILSDVKFGETLTLVYQTSLGSSSFASGTMIEFVHLCSSFIRDFLIRNSSRREIYDSDTYARESEASHLKLMKEEFVKFISGKMPNQ